MYASVHSATDCVCVCVFAVPTRGVGGARGDRGGKKLTEIGDSRRPTYRTTTAFPIFLASHRAVS